MDRVIHIVHSPAKTWRFIPPPCGGAPYSLLLISLRQVSREEKNRITSDIIASGARYIVCWGMGCEDWHDTLDWAYLQTDENLSPPPERFVMTTWHDDEPLTDAVFHLLFCGIIDDALPEHVGVFILGDTPNINESLQSALTEHAPDAKTICVSPDSPVLVAPALF